MCEREWVFREWREETRSVKSDRQWGRKCEVGKQQKTVDDVEKAAK